MTPREIEDMEDPESIKPNKPLEKKEGVEQNSTSPDDRMKCEDYIEDIKEF